MNLFHLYAQARQRNLITLKLTTVYICRFYRVVCVFKLVSNSVYFVEIDHLFYIMYIYMHTYIYVSVFVCVCLCVSVCVCVCLCVSVCVCVCVYKWKPRFYT